MMKVKQIKMSIFSIVIALTLIIVAVVPVAAYPAYDVYDVSEEEIRSGDFGYYVLSDGTIRLSAYYGSDENLEISIIDGYEVSAIGNGGAQWFFTKLDPNGNDFRKTKSIKLPKTLSWFLYNNAVSCFGNWISIENIYVDEENPYFKSENGIFYNKDMTKLLFYPEGKKSLVYKVPESINAIENLSRNKYLEKVYLGKNISSIYDYALDNCPNVTLYVYENTYALDWAKNHNFPYEIISDEPQYIYGDVNLDGEVSVSDATAIQKLIIGIDVPEEQTELINTLADVNNDGVVSILDATCIQKYLVGYSDNYRTGELLETQNL